MKYVSEFRDAALVEKALAEIRRLAVKPCVLMEICGGQTHSIMRSGLDRMLPASISLVHGPGCPVCVTPIEILDKAMLLAGRPGVIFTSFGDMLRVPGSREDLFSVRSRGGDVRVVYSPLDAVAIAQRNPDRDVVFFAIGFETTAPANAMSVLLASRLGIRNFSLLVSHACVPAAMRAILDAPDNRVQGFLAAGHVCAVMGLGEYQSIAGTYRVPIVVTGFEPIDLVHGILAAVRQLQEGRVNVENAYRRVVREDGNPSARALVDRVFTVTDRAWRGIGVIPDSGLRLRDAFAPFDAERRFDLGDIRSRESERCLAGEILRGLRKPPSCPAFGVECTPDTPLGATMVSDEGACAAHYRYGRVQAGKMVPS